MTGDVIDVRRVPLDYADKAAGLVTVIDVRRALTTAAPVSDASAEAVVVVADVEEAAALREENQGWLIMGEEDGLQVMRPVSEGEAL